MQHHLTRLMLAAALALLAATPESRSQPLVNKGIGIASCATLSKDLKPDAGLDHLPNALLFYWVQGYISAANVYLLGEYTDYVDLNTVEEPVIIKLVAEFCQANPDKKPIAAIDKFIRDTAKVEAKESDAFDPWEH
ncbi:MAG TPA: hypothetical protein VGD36_06875 [Xanthobacteraceae bacterium]|jgi:hypothetical protein